MRRTDKSILLWSAEEVHKMAVQVVLFLVVITYGIVLQVNINVSKKYTYSILTVLSTVLCDVTT
jgi:hypothetical protein